MPNNWRNEFQPHTGKKDSFKWSFIAGRCIDVKIFLERVSGELWGQEVEYRVGGKIWKEEKMKFW